MRRGEIYMVALDPTFGREQQGHRPVVIVSPDTFNRATGLPVVLPITNGGEFAKKTGFAVPLSDTKTTGIVRCDQPRVLDVVARGGGRMVEMLPKAILEEILARTLVIFQ